MFDFENVVDNQIVVEEFEEVVMGFIINFGQVCSLVYGVFRKVKEGDFEVVKVMMDQLCIVFNEVYFVQIKFIEGDQGEGKMKVSLVLVYVQDYLMILMLVCELIVELIEFYEKLK